MDLSHQGTVDSLIPDNEAMAKNDIFTEEISCIHGFDSRYIPAPAPNRADSRIYIIKVTSQWAPWRLKLSTAILFAQPLFRRTPSLAFMRGIHRCPMDFPHKVVSNPKKGFHLTTSSCNFCMKMSFARIPIALWILLRYNLTLILILHALNQCNLFMNDVIKWSFPTRKFSVTSQA